MAWIKMGSAAGFVTGVFGLLFLALVRAHQRMKFAFAIPRDTMVRGDVRVNVGANEVCAARQSMRCIPSAM